MYVYLVEIGENSLVFSSFKKAKNYVVYSMNEQPLIEWSIDESHKWVKFYSCNDSDLSMIITKKLVI